MSGGTVALVPIRSLTGGKTRLAGAVDAEARAELTRLMLANVLRAMGDTAGIDAVVVVSPDPAALLLAAEMLPAVQRLAQPIDDLGLLPALEIGRSHALGLAADALMIVFGDLPRLAASDLEALLAPPVAVVLAPDRARTGTNALLLRGSAVAAFPFRFGERSFPAHVDESWGLGVDPAVVERDGLAFDLDTPGDLALLPTTMAMTVPWRAAS